MPRIGSFNCQYKLHLTTGFFQNTAGLDVACTQESGTRMQMQNLIANRPNFYVAGAFADDPAVVVTQTSDRAAGNTDIAIGAGLNGNRSALLVQLRSGFVVVNVHLTSGNVGRSVPELLEIYNYIQTNYNGRPWLIIGDFNHDPTGFGNGVSIVRGPQHSGGSYLDWAMAGNITTIIAGALPNYQGSDHAPWYVDIT